MEDLLAHNKMLHEIDVKNKCKKEEAKFQRQLQKNGRRWKDDYVLYRSKTKEYVLRFGDCDIMYDKDTFRAVDADTFLPYLLQRWQHCETFHVKHGLETPVTEYDILKICDPWFGEKELDKLGEYGITFMKGKLCEI